jgi:hypothetical protein
LTLQNNIDERAQPTYIASVPASQETASNPQASACGPSLALDSLLEPAALYVDGFNLYHAIDRLGEPHLKWLNLWALGELLIPKVSQKLVRVVYCSAKKPGASDKNQRHEEYMSALKYYGVERKLGHFITNDPLDCKGCGRVWYPPKEKESDVNLALSVIDDAYRNIFKHAYLISADSDQGATARMFKERFPDKTLTSVSPPGMSHSLSIKQHTKLGISLQKGHLEKCLLPAMVVDDVDGKPTLRFRRPADYAPPLGWSPPKR